MLKQQLGKIRQAKNLATAKVKAASTPSDQYIVALDVGTEFVKALVAKIDGSKLEIVGAGRSHQELSDMQAGAIADIGAVVQNCNQALAAAEEQAGVSVRTAVLGIAGELVKGTTSTVRCTRKEPGIEIDVEEMQQIIDLVQERAEQQARKALAVELGGKHLEVRLVNSALVSITIDGYVVTNPIGFKGRDVVVQLYTAFAPMIHISALERVATELDLDLLAVAAEPFAVARSVIGDNPNASMSAVLMDVGGGTTDIAVINDGGVQGTKMFGIGGRAFTRSIERELGIDFELAEKYKLSANSGVLPPKKHDDVAAALDKTCDVWVSGVELALSEFTELDNIPHRILLCGGGASLENIHHSLEETNWYRDVPFTRKPKVAFITPDQVVGITDTTGKVNDHTFVTAMGLLRVGLDTLDQQDGKSTESIKNKFDKILRV
jgi:cell division protein FtsA